MAIPQTENGYTRIANELVEQFATLNLSKYEWRVLWVVIRKTYGWNKKIDKISVSQIEQMTGIDRRNVSRSKKSLIKKGVIVEFNNKIGLNKNYNEWGSSKEMTGTIVYRDTRQKLNNNLVFPGGVKENYSDSAYCEWCTNEFHWHETEAHHIVPKSFNGIDKKENLTRLCKLCHSKAHADMKTWLIVNSDDIQGWYRHFVSLLSSIQTTFLSSVQTAQKTIKENNNKRHIPKSFGISERVKIWASKKGINNLEDHLENFITSCEAKGYKYSNWDSAFMNAIRKNWANITTSTQKEFPQDD